MQNLILLWDKGISWKPTVSYLEWPFDFVLRIIHSLLGLSSPWVQLVQTKGSRCKQIPNIVSLLLHLPGTEACSTSRSFHPSQTILYSAKIQAPCLVPCGAQAPSPFPSRASSLSTQFLVLGAVGFLRCSSMPGPFPSGPQYKLHPN